VHDEDSVLPFYAVSSDPTVRPCRYIFFFFGLSPSKIVRSLYGVEGISFRFSDGRLNRVDRLNVGLKRASKIKLKSSVIFFYFFLRLILSVLF